MAAFTEADSHLQRLDSYYPDAGPPLQATSLSLKYNDINDLHFADDKLYGYSAQLPPPLIKETQMVTQMV